MIDKRSDEQVSVERLWTTYLMEGQLENEQRQRRFFRFLPGNRRCKNCYAPFDGPGSLVVRALYGKQPSTYNPRLCNVCEQFARKNQGGADVELSLLFADVRGSTELAERMTPHDYSQLINRFYDRATQIMVQTDALIDKIIGDQASGMYVPGFVGSNTAARAIGAAQEILKATGHGEPGEPWIPLGVGVHSGVAFVGSVVSAEGSSDITVLGDVPNTAARLASSAGVGEILMSDRAYRASGLDFGVLEARELRLKGKRTPVRVSVLPPVRIGEAPQGSGSV